VTNLESIQTEPPRDLSEFRNTPIRPFHVQKDALASVPSSETLPNPVGLSASSTEKEDDDDWSDENLRMWEEEDKLDSELAQWLQAQRGE
jgi:hypothetical protein